MLQPPPLVEITPVLSRRWERCTGRDLRAAAAHAERLQQEVPRWLTAILTVYGDRLDSEPTLTLGELAAEIGVTT